MWVKRWLWLILMGSAGIIIGGIISLGGLGLMEDTPPDKFFLFCGSIMFFGGLGSLIAGISEAKKIKNSGNRLYVSPTSELLVKTVEYAREQKLDRKQQTDDLEKKQLEDLVKKQQLEIQRLKEIENKHVEEIKRKQFDDSYRETLSRLHRSFEERKKRDNK